jgi:hypothetical protein
MTGYTADEEERLQLLIPNQGFLHATNRREETAVACNFLRRFVDGQLMTFESIGRFFGVRPAIIQAQIELAKSFVGASGRPGLLSAATKEWFENLICT